tara:strand:- start:1701 stop:2660 length:960 start_codon:yes stop_codon:yes gene_type:complete
MNNSRLTVFPIVHPKLWELYKKQLACFWKAEEIDFSKDRDDFNCLSENEQTFIKKILAFFSFADGLINANLEERFIKEVPEKEAKIAYDFQKTMENIHGEVYSIMLEVLIPDPVEKQQMFNCIQEVESLKKVHDWVYKWIHSDSRLACRLVCFALIEGVFFSSAFACIFWIKRVKNKGAAILNGLVMSNEFIARDEALHTEFAAEYYKGFIDDKLSREEVSVLVKECVSVVHEFVADCLPYNLMGINKMSMDQYVESCSDKVCEMLGYEKIFHTEQPFEFMKTIGIYGHTNFFECRPTQYQDANVLNKSSRQFELQLDF